MSPIADSMATPDASEYGLRARGKADSRCLSQLSNRDRGLRAAFDILKGTLSPRSAKNKYLVDRHTLQYYRSKLVADGVEAVVACTPAAAAPGSQAPTADDAEKENMASKVEAWGEYCSA